MLVLHASNLHDTLKGGEGVVEGGQDVPSRGEMAVGAPHAAGRGHRRGRDGAGKDGAAGSVPGGPPPQPPLPALHHRVPRHGAAPVAARAAPLVPPLPRHRPARVPARRHRPPPLPPVRPPVPHISDVVL